MNDRTKDRIRNGIEGLLAYGSKFIYRLAIPTTSAFIQGNLPDITDIISEYSFIRMLWLEKPSKGWAIALPAIYTALEAGQYFGIIEGTFDPKDILCYAVGGTLVFGIDKLLYKKEK